jgi:hypothetical protein
MRDFRAVLTLLTTLFLVTSPPLAAREGESDPANPGDRSATVAELKRLLPAEAEGWKASGEDRVFTRDTVAEYAGKSADILLGFPFRLLLVRDYLGEPEGAVLSAEIYDMSTSADAFGIFSHGPPGERVEIAQEGLLSGSTLRFWKGNIFVRLRGSGGPAGARSVLVALGRRIAASIIRTGARPRILAGLPSDGLNAESVRYFHTQVSLDLDYYLADRKALFLDETSDVALGKYPSAGSETLLLVVRYASPQNADRAFRRFGGDFFPAGIGPGTRRIVEEIGPGVAAAALRTGEFLVLVLEAPDKAAAEGLLRSAELRVGKEYGSKRLS